NDHRIGAGIRSAHAREQQAAGGLTSERGTALEPLIVQGGPRGIDTKAGSRAWAVGDAQRRRSNDDVLVKREAGNVRNGVTARATDNDRVSSGIRSAHT